MKLSHINSLLLTLILLINGYVILAPLLPAIIFSWENHQGRIVQLQQRIVQTKTINSFAQSGNTLIVPSMILDQPIHDGPINQQYQILDQGIWRWPMSSTPDKGGNTVLMGHRFTYTNPKGVFYYLNKISMGETLAVIWNHKEYLYTVVSVNQVTSNDTTIEANTPNPQLTLFTCTPLWLPKDRLVVIASLKGAHTDE